MRTTEATKGQWAMIFEHYGLSSITDKHHFRGKCLLYDSIGKFRIDNRDGAGIWICTCGYGTGLDLVTRTQGKPFDKMCRKIDKLISNTSGRDKVPGASNASKLRKKAFNDFTKMAPLRSTSSVDHPDSRGIFKPLTETVRLNPKQRRNGRACQSIHSLATNDKGELCYLHQTLLDDTRKADIGAGAERQKLLQEDSYLDHARSIAICMFPVTNTLGIAESIRMVLSACQIYNVNTWAAMTTSFMKKFHVSTGVKHLVISADHGENSTTGLVAAHEYACADLLVKNGLQRMSVYWPDHGDLNSMLVNGDQVRELVFHEKKMAV